MRQKLGSLNRKLPKGVRDLGGKSDLHGNHLSLFAAVASNLGRKGGLGAKMSHVTRNPRKARKTLITICSRLRDLTGSP